MTKESYNFGVDTEAKRLYTETSGMTAKKFVIKDNIIYFDDDGCGDFTEQNVLALLNKQYETIQWIKQDIKEIQINCIECEKKMREENEQLRELLENGLEVSQVEIDEELERMNKNK